MWHFLLLQTCSEHGLNSFRDLAMKLTTKHTIIHVIIPAPTPCRYKLVGSVITSECMAPFSPVFMNLCVRGGLNYFMFIMGY
jgi:hypothetical protein